MGSTGTGDPQRFIARPFEAFPAADGTYLVMPAHAIRPVELEQPVVEALALCDGFRALAGHVQVIGQRHPGWRSDPAGLQRALNRLRELALIVSEQDLAAELAAPGNGAGEPARLDTVFIRTCERPRALRRLLGSIAQAAPAGLRDIVVLDDARTETGNADTAAAISAGAAPPGVALHHVTRAARRRLARELVESGPGRSALETWLLGPPDAAATYGAVVNSALLLGAGQRFALFDDDATLAAFGPPAPDPSRLRFARSVQRRYRVAETDAALREQCPPSAQDALARHGDALGATLGELVSRLEPGQRPALFDGLEPGLLTALRPDSRVRVSVNGVLGDPGTVHSLGLLHGPFDDLARLAAAGDRFAGLLRTGRVGRVAAAPTLSTDTALMTTTLTGIDARDLLPPTLPAGRGEDLVLGASIAFVHPGSLAIDLPFMLAHRPEEPARPERGEFARPRRPGAAALLAGVIESQSLAVDVRDPVRRIRRLAAAMGELGEADDDRIAHQIARRMADSRAELIGAFGANLQRLQPAAPVARVFEQAIAAQRRFGDEDAAHCASQVREVRAAARFAGSALEHWCDAWQAARERSLGDLLHACSAAGRSR